MNNFRTIALTITFICFVSVNHSDELDGHFSTWEDVPAIINSLTATEYLEQLRQLHKLTRIKLGFPQVSLGLNKEEHKKYMLQTKENWKRWWESTGKPISKQKKQGAKVDRQAFNLAWEFLGIKEFAPIYILPVWIIDRQPKSASLTKLRGDYSKKGKGWGQWRVALSEQIDFSIERADQILKSLCYLHRYAPPINSKVPKNTLGGYYPHASMYLRDSKNRILWNTHGYEFSKTRAQFGDGETGRSYYFLKTVFSDKNKWKDVINPTSTLLSPYRRLLAFSKPYFSSNASDIIQLFGQKGMNLEKLAMLDWAKKQQTSTKPNISWQVRSNYFSTGAKVNVINSTRYAIQKTQKEIKRLGARLQGEQKTSQDNEVKKLDLYIANMLILEKKEIKAKSQKIKK
ncbi:MAG: hypothetical protein COA79_22805 [Planctomycetota bacterium]|nr:MAG: hypothetical protein COA79_22805 [Planctomycetota bacterium]